MSIIKVSKSAFVISILISIFPLIAGYFFQSYSQNEELDKLIHFVKEDLLINIPVHIRYGDEGFNFPDLATAIQLQINIESLKLFGKRWKIEIYDELEYSKDLSLKINNKIQNEFTLNLFYGQECYLLIDPKGIEAHLYYDATSIHSNDLPFYVSQTILYHLVNQEINTFKFGISKNSTIGIQIILGHKSGSKEIEGFYQFINEQVELLSNTYGDLDIEVFEEFNSSSPLNVDKNIIYVIEDEFKGDSIFKNDSSIVYLKSNTFNLSSEKIIQYWSEIHHEIIEIYNSTRKEANIAEGIGIMKHSILDLLVSVITSLQNKLIRNNTFKNIYQRAIINNFYDRMYNLIDTVNDGRSLDWDSIKYQAYQLHEDILNL